MSMMIGKGPTRMFSMELAERIGVSEAIIIQQIHYWLQKSSHDIKGRKWVYNSYEEWHEQFPFWALSTVRRLISKLEKDGLLISDNFNRMKMDRTKWYSIDYEKLAQLDISLASEKIEAEDTFLADSIWIDGDELDEEHICSQGAEHCTEENRAIPKITTKITSKNKKNIKKSRSNVICTEKV